MTVAASRILSCLLAAAALTGASLTCGPWLPSAAQAQVPDTASIVQGSIRPGWRQDDGTHIAALHLTLADNWKTYWRAPGDAGIPPRFDWSGSRNLSGVVFHWPRPIVFDQGGMRSIGYIRELVLPMQFSLADPAAPAQLRGRVELGVCETVCVPVTLELRAELRPDGASDPLIRTALADQPRPATALGLRDVHCIVDPIADGLRVSATLDLPRLGSDEVVVFELADSSIWISESRAERQGGRLHAVAEMVPVTGAPFGLDRSSLRITVLGSGQAADLRGCPAP